MKPTVNSLRNALSNKKYLIVSVFFISAVFSLFFLAFFAEVGPSQHQEFPADYQVHYEPIAKNILEGKGITKNDQVMTHFSPGYPVILAGIFLLSSFSGISIFSLILSLNIILAALSAVLIFLIADNIFGKRIGLIASLLWLSYPFNLWFVKNAHSEVPFIPLFLLAVLFYVFALKQEKTAFAFLSGFFVSLSLLVKLTTIFLAPFLFFLTLLFFRKSAFKKQLFIAFSFLLGFAVAFSPWALYAYSNAGNIVSPKSLGAKGVSFGITILSIKGQGGDEFNLSYDIKELIEKVKKQDFENKTRSEFINFFARELVVNPAPVLKLVFIKLSRSWYATSQGWWEEKIFLVQLLYLLTAIFGFISVRKNKYALFLSMVILYFWTITFFNVSIMRYMVPIMGLVMIFSAVFINVFIEKIIKKKLIIWR